MSTKIKKAQIITDRDQRLFQFLFDSKVSTASQVRDRFFSNKTLRVTHKRLAKLRNANWLRLVTFTDGQYAKNAYSLTDKAYQEFVLIKDVNDRRCQLASDVVLHDLALVELRISLEKMPQVLKFYSENILQSYWEYSKMNSLRDIVELRSDAVLEILTKDENKFLVPLEYEASQKTKERWHKKFLDYYIKHEGDAVLWVCQNDSIRSGLCEIERELSKGYKPKMYFTLLQNILSSPEKITFTDFLGNEFQIQ